MCFRRNWTVKYIIVATVGALLYCEFFVYLLQQVYWDELKCHPQDVTCTKILFVADPQIQGDDAVSPPLSYLFNYDADKYLKSTFQTVTKHFKPDVIVYMGDLMDEGSVASRQQFHHYALRLTNIFDFHSPVVQIWIPGDNDIGGENEPIKKDKVEEFEKIFYQPSAVAYKNVTFYKVNGITHSFPKLVEEKNFRIVVSHYPVTVLHHFGEIINNAIRPKIYFCAHEHESKFVKQTSQLTFRETIPFKYGDEVLNISFNGDKLYEIYVPTCSYRMGTSKIGFGAAVLENNNRNMRYTVFWSPQRFPYLVFYLILLLVIYINFLVFTLPRLCTKFNPKYARVISNNYVKK